MLASGKTEPHACNLHYQDALPHYCHYGTIPVEKMGIAQSILRERKRDRWLQDAD
jgi:hypothetical protein